ncbi:MAG: hypothetical protein GX286_03520 [Clostridiales bacterium]|nr:hypothetical protein [Clostridiales bacterium]
MKFKYSKIAPYLIALLYVTVIVLTLKGMFGIFSITVYFTILAVLYFITSKILEVKEIFTKKMTVLLLKYLITVVCISGILLINNMSYIKFYLVIHLFFAGFFALRFTRLYKEFKAKSEKEDLWAEITKSLQRINTLAGRLPKIIYDNISEDIDILNQIINESPADLDEKVNSVEKKIFDAMIALEDLIQLMLETNRVEYSIVTNKVIRLRKLIQERVDILSGFDESKN